MKFEFIDIFLASKGFSPPLLDILQEGRELLNYALIQPAGNVEADEYGVRNSQANNAYEKVKLFIQEARADNCELIITPEYFCPWQLVVNLNSDLKPATNQLWILCFESITPDGLAQIQSSSTSLKLFYSIPPNQHGTFLNPLMYVFWAKNNETQEDELVGILQFKTKSMVDTRLQLERGELIFGSDVYIFREPNSIHLCSIICSDALDFDPNTIGRQEGQRFGPWNHSPFILVHPQLNISPSHQFFRKYRTDWLGQNIEKKQIICLNWAQGTSLNGTPSSEEEFGKTAIHFKENVTDDFKSLKRSHERGIYYTKLVRSHALFLNFHEGEISNLVES